MWLAVGLRYNMSRFKNIATQSIKRKKDPSPRNIFLIEWCQCVEEEIKYSDVKLSILDY